MNRLVLLSVVVQVAASTASAQFAGSIGLFTDSDGTDCTIATGLVELHVIHYGHGGATASEFMLDVYPIWWTYLGEEWDYTAIGTSITGVSVDYGGCATSPTHLGIVRFFATAGPPCEEVGVGPAPGNLSIESLDCNGSLTFPSGSLILADCGPCGVRPPYDLQPSDGAEGVSLYPTLSWSWQEPTGCQEGIGLTFYTVYLGTELDNLTQVGWVDTDTTLSVGPLQANTSYYWQVSVFDDFYNCPGNRTAYSAVQSFTTAGPVPTERTTWGNIKNLFK
jgi:hypothetical protein